MAWISFLVAAGVCSALAVKFSTKNIVQSGVNSTLEGTQTQFNEAIIKITHPVQDLYDYLVNKHKSLHDNLLTQYALQGYMHEAAQKKKEGIEIMENGDEISAQVLERKVNMMRNGVNDLQNECGTSISTIKILAENVKNDKIINQIDEYEKMFTKLIELKREVIENKAEFSPLNKMMFQINQTYVSLIEMVGDYKKEVFGQIKEGEKFN